MKYLVGDMDVGWWQVGNTAKGLSRKNFRVIQSKFWLGAKFLFKENMCSELQRWEKVFEILEGTGNREDREMGWSEKAWLSLLRDKWIKQHVNLH